MNKTLVFFGLLLWALVGCQRDLGQGSRLQATMPDHPDVSGKSSNTTLAANAQKVCYILTVNGSGIPSNGSDCSADNGMSSAFVAPGTAVALDIPFSDARQLKLDIYLLFIDKTLSCQEASSNMAAHSPAKIYWMGGQQAEASGGDIGVTIKVKFPGIGQHIAATRDNINMASCVPNPPKEDHLASYMNGHLSGQKYQLRGQFGGAQGTAMTGSRYQLQLTKDP